MSYPGSTTVGAEIDPHWSSFWLSQALDRRNGLGVSLQLLPERSKAHDHAADQGAGSKARQGQETVLLFEWTHRLQRWNLPGAQANVWLFAGVGGYHNSGSDRRPGALADAAHPGHGGGSGPQPGHYHGSHLQQPLTSQPQAGPPVQPSTPATPASLRLAASPGLQIDIETTRLRLEGQGRLVLAAGVQRSLLTATAGVGLTPAHYNGTQPWLELQLRAMPGLIDGVELIPKLRLVHRRLVLDLGYSSLGSLVGGFTFTL